jgi:hypothetical protein
MQMRDKQAAEIESRLSKLRQQYQDRQASKDRIIELQLKVIEADAAGLGFPSGDSVRPTPSSPPRGPANPFRNSKQVGSTPDDPMIRSVVPSAIVPAQRADQHDPIPTERTLDEAKRTYPTVVAELRNRGHFIESADGRLYAYANVDRRSGFSMVRVIDSVTGKLIATGLINSPVGALQFTNEGVASREADGLVQLRVPLKTRATHDRDVFEPGAAAANPEDQDPSPQGASLGQPGTSALSVSPHSSVTSEYNELRVQYRKAKARLAVAEAQFNALLASVQKQKPETSSADVKKLQPDSWKAVELARPDFEAAHRLLESKLELLELDLKTAISARDAAKSRLEQLTVAFKGKEVALLEVNKQTAALEAAELNVDRAKSLLSLFKSIKSEPLPPLEESPSAARVNEKANSGAHADHSDGVDDGLGNHGN